MLCMKADELTTNGDFNTGDFTGWVVSDPSNQTFVSPGFGYNEPSVSDPNAYAAISGSIGVTATISQVLGTLPGQNYSISFALATDGLTNDNFGATFGDQTLLPYSAQAGSNGYTLLTYNVTADQYNTSLQFQSQDDGGFNLLDNVSVQGAKTPEPSSLLLVVPALGALLLRRRATR